MFTCQNWHLYNMKRFFVVVFLFFYIQFANGQIVQWATEVVEFSSELTPIQYSAAQALGKPNVLPAGGESPSAWTPDRANSKEFLKLGYANPIAIKQIAIAESYNPSAITAVFIYDEADNEYLVTNLGPRAIPLKGRLLNLFFETDYKVKAVKIVFDGASVPEYYSIDAVAISDSDIQIITEPEIAEAVASGVIVERLSENVNSEYKEFKPLLSPDGNTLYFSRKNHPENIGGIDDPEDIWFSEKDENGEWKKAKNIGAELNTDGPNYVSAITPDGKTAIMLLGNKYLENGQMEAGVSITSNASGSWSKPIPLQIDNDYNYSEKANFYLANNRRVLLMSVERDDTHGDRDLYVCFVKGDSTWSEPVNLGTVVNTAAAESAPFLAADDRTLYFSSNGFSGYGKSDIYVTKRLDDTWTNWSEPQNMGPEINSEHEDLFFNIPSSSKFAYYSRGVSDDDTDIFQIELPLFQRPDPTVTVKGLLLDSKTGLPLTAKITYERLSDGKELGMIESNPITGQYQIILPLGEIYGIHAEAEGYMSQSENLDLRDYKGGDIGLDHENFKLVPLKVEETIVLNNVFFEFDKAELMPESFSELNRVVKLMNEKESLEIEVKGHTDNSGPDSYNLLLSKRRSEAVSKYILGKGIASDRIETTWFGETQPKFTNETREGRIKNRRVEFTIKKN